MRSKAALEIVATVGAAMLLWLLVPPMFGMFVNNCIISILVICNAMLLLGRDPEE